MCACCSKAGRYLSRTACALKIWRLERRSTVKTFSPILTILVMTPFSWACSMSVSVLSQHSHSFSTSRHVDILASRHLNISASQHLRHLHISTSRYLDIQNSTTPHLDISTFQLLNIWTFRHLDKSISCMSLMGLRKNVLNSVTTNDGFTQSPEFPNNQVLMCCKGWFL